MNKKVDDMVSEKTAILALISNLLHEKRTGNATEFAKKVGISRSSLFNYFDELRNYDAVVELDEENDTYYYEEWVEVDLVIRTQSGKSFTPVEIVRKKGSGLK